MEVLCTVRDNLYLIIEKIKKMGNNEIENEENFEIIENVMDVEYNSI